MALIGRTCSRRGKHFRVRMHNRQGLHEVLDGGLTGTVRACAKGVLCVVCITWTGRLVRQVVYPWCDWWGLSPAARRKTVMSFFKKPNSQKPPVGGGGVGVFDAELSSECPTLACYLFADTWPDGEVRQRSSLVVFCEDGIFKVCLSDKDTSNTLWASSTTFSGICGALECRLTEDHPDWRKQRIQKKKA